MPQEHYVLRCFSCGTFQAHIVKKTKKWECKMCGAKQSVKRNYGRGSGKDCRNQVMKLNELRLRNECNFNETEAGISDDELVLPELKIQFDSNKPISGKWEKYLDKPVTDPENEDDESETDFSVEMKKKKRVIKMPENCSSNIKKVCWESNVNEVSPSVGSCLLSPESYKKNFKNFKTEEKAMEKESPVQSRNKLKLSKYAKYMDDYSHINDVDIDGVAGGDFKVSKSDVTMVKKSLNVFDSEPTDLDEILSFE